MARPFKGVVNIDIKDSTPDWEPYTQPIAPEGAPNVLYVVLDDVGFSAMEPFGGLIETPNIKRIAAQGLTYTNFHTTALCSPTRSCLMTGRNHTTNGMGCITEATSGFPNANGHIPFECANIAEVLGERGWNTYIVGKWHLCAEDEMNLASSKRQWPLGRGFERYYGFLGGETNQWYPDLVYDNHPVAAPKTPEEGYHLTVDLTDKAIEFIQDAKAIAPDKPFFLYYCPGAAHAPHHVSKEWADRYKGMFDMGYEAYREGVFERQKKLGIIAEGAELSPIDPYADTTSHDGKPWSQGDRVRPWESLSDDEKRLFARMAEVYAGFLSHADHELGRLLDYLEESGQLENTIVVLVSDNGASGEGGPNGSVNENKFFNGLPDTMEENLKYLDELGSPRTYNHYPTGWAWAFNTPFKLWKRYANYEGGTADPLIVSWPAGIDAQGRAPPPVQPRRRHRADAVRVPRRRAAGRRQRLHAEAARGRQLQEQPRRPGGTVEGDAVLLDARHPGDLAQGLEGRDRRACRARVVGRLPPAALGAVRHDDRPERVPRSRGRAPGEAAGADRAVVGRGRHLPGASARVARRDRDPRRRAAPALEPTHALHLLPGRRGGTGVGRAEHPEPLVHDRRGDGDRHGGGRRRDLLAGLTLRWSRPVRQGRASSCTPTTSSASTSRRSSPTRRSRPATSFSRPRSSARTRRCRRRARSRSTSATRQVGEATIMTQPGKFGLGGGGLVVGRSGAEQVTDDYVGEAPWPFVGGTVKRVMIDVSGESFTDLAAEARAAFARQ